jgi:hypothetical protein
MGFTVVVAKSDVEDSAKLNELVSPISVVTADSSEHLLISPLPGKLIDVLSTLTRQKIKYELRSEGDFANG